MHSLKETILLLVDKGDVNQALGLIHDFVERIITEPLCTSQFFGSKTLDELCQCIGKENLTEIGREIGGATSSQRDQPVIAYIVTKLQKSGGHTRVIEDFVKAQPKAQHVILSTELVGPSDTNYVLRLISKQTNVVVEKSPKVTYQSRLMWLQKRLLQIHPTKSYLFNHHQDCVAVAAIQPEMEFDSSFYHHGDHHLCLGVYLSHLKHIDPHPMGYRNCRDVLDIKNTYIPLTIEDKGARPTNWPFLPNGIFTTCTAARSNKIEVPYFVSYLKLIPELLKVTEGKHIHIGQLTPWALFKIRRGLKSYGIHPDRFLYTPWVPSVWQTLHEYRVDLYIASFPYGGGLTLIEAMGAGVPVALHRHIFSRILSSLELGYPEAFSWRYPEELFHYCATVTSNDLEKGGRSGRLQYEKFHRAECLQESLSKIADNTLPPCGLSDKFTVADDERAIWMEQQLSFRRLFWRTFYRTFKRIRSKI